MESLLLLQPSVECFVCNDIGDIPLLWENVALFDCSYIVGNKMYINFLHFEAECGFLFWGLFCASLTHIYAKVFLSLPLCVCVYVCEIVGLHQRNKFS